MDLFLWRNFLHPPNLISMLNRSFYSSTYRKIFLPEVHNYWPRNTIIYRINQLDMNTIEMLQSFSECVLFRRIEMYNFSTTYDPRFNERLKSEQRKNFYWKLGINEKTLFFMLFLIFAIVFRIFLPFVVCFTRNREKKHSLGAKADQYDMLDEFIVDA